MDDAQVVQAVLAGEAEAYGALVAHHRGRLYVLAFGLTGDAERAADLVQEALIAAYEALPRLRDGASFGAWAAAILRNRFFSEQRRHGPPTLSLDALREAGFDPPAPATEEGFEPGLVEQVGALVASLPEIYRLPLLLRYGEDLSYREIAGTLGLRLTTVAMRLTYGRRLLLKKARRAGLIGPAAAERICKNIKREEARANARQET